MTRKSLAILASGGFASAILSGSAALAAAYEADKISFRDITGAVEITTHNGDEIDVTIRQADTHQPVKIYEEDGVVIVEGERWKEEETKDCCNNRIRREFHARRDRQMSTGEPVDEGFFAKYPTLVVSVPVDSDVDFVDARILLSMERLDGALSLDACYVYGETSDVDEAVIGVVAGSRLVVGNIGGALEIDVSGDADVMTGSAAMADIDIAGPGDVITDAIDGMMDVSIAGSGLVRTSRLDGPLTVRIAGSGGVAVQGGRADKLKATIDGSGGVSIDGVAVAPELRLFGSSEVRMSSVTGRITRHGGGDVYVGGELVEKE